MIDSKEKNVNKRHRDHHFFMIFCILKGTFEDITGINGYKKQVIRNAAILTINDDDDDNDC